MLKIKIIFILFALAISSPAFALKAVATFYPVYLIAKNVAGNSVTVELLVPPGTELHEFTLKPHDIIKLQSADLVLLNGAGIEVSIMKAIDPKKTVDTSQGVDLLKHDSHIWLDPLNAIIQAENIKSALIKSDPRNKDLYEKNTASFKERLKALHSDTDSSLKRANIRYLITYHEAFAYFARRYGLDYYSLTGPDAETPLPGRVKTVYDIVRRNKVKAVFGEKNYPSAALERLRADLAVKVCGLDPMEGGPLSPGHYEEAMRDNLNSIIKCLAGK